MLVLNFTEHTQQKGTSDQGYDLDGCSVRDVFSANITTSSCMLCSRLTSFYIQNLQREYSAVMWSYIAIYIYIV